MALKKIGKWKRCCIFRIFLGTLPQNRRSFSGRESSGEFHKQDGGNVREATGAANTAFERQTNTLKYDIQMIKNLGANFLTQLGTNILPYVREFAEAALPVVSRRRWRRSAGYRPEPSFRRRKPR